MREVRANPDRLIARIAGRQHGVVTVAQLSRAGIGKDGITRRLRCGRLYRLHRGVYAVGHMALSSEGRWLAAVLACGEGAVLSHRSAAGLWRLLPPVVRPVDVSVPGGGGRRKRGQIRLHRRPSLLPADVTRRLSIPVTTPAQTLADLGKSVAAEQRLPLAP